MDNKEERLQEFTPKNCSMKIKLIITMSITCMS